MSQHKPVTLTEWKRTAEAHGLPHTGIEHDSHGSYLYAYGSGPYAVLARYTLDHDDDGQELYAASIHHAESYADTVDFYLGSMDYDIAMARCERANEEAT